jgi:hypothetical protein
MNTVVIGLTKAPILEHLPEEFLIVDDGTTIDRIKRRARRFDVEKHAFNPLKDMTYQRARAFLDVLNAVFPEGENTLTKRNSNFVLLKALLAEPRMLSELVPKPNPKDTGALDAYQKVQTLLLSPVLERVLETGLSFPFTGTILAKLDRATLGDFDCFVLGNLLISLYPGPVVIPDFGFYAHKGHMALIRQNRLIAGVSSFDEVPRFKTELLLVENKIASKCTPADAEILANYAGLRPGSNAFNDFVDGAIGAHA